jgi:amidase
VRPYAQEVGADPGRLRIGVLFGSPREGVAVDPACSEAARIAARALETLGHRVEESSPAAYADTGVGRAFVTIIATNIARSLEAVGEKLGRALEPDDVEATTWAVANIGRGVPAPTLLAMLQWTHQFGRRMAEWWAEDGFDLLLTPTTGAPAPPLGHFASPPDVPLKGYLMAAPFGAFTFPINMTGQPSISLPLHKTAAGLPVGAMLTAAYGREDLLLRVAAQLEQSVGWTRRE